MVAAYILARGITWCPLQGHFVDDLIIFNQKNALDSLFLRVLFMCDADRRLDQVAVMDCASRIKDVSGVGRFQPLVLGGFKI